jgi:cytochrome b6-f complex iron-sulfur subunit
MAEKKKMSVAEILAAARKKDGGGAPGGESAAPAESAPSAEAPSSAVEEAVSSESPASESSAPAPAPKAAPAKPGERPSVKDILAMARSGPKPGAVAPAKPAVKAPAEKAPVAKAAPEKSKAAAAKPAAAAAPVKDTASILAAARKGAKPGPMTKAEAATVEAKASPKAPPKEKLAVPPMPAKPAYAKLSPAKAPVEEDRRGFLQMILGSALGLGMTALSITGGLWALGTARFMFPNVLTEPPNRFKVGFKENFSPGQVETKFVSQYGVWVVNGEYNGSQQIYALKTVCTHLGCTPNWLEGEQKFKCPCHGSGFYKDGINFEGPAPRPLERYAVRIGDDGQLEIDKSKTFQEELGQWVDPDSFVLV